MRKFGRCAHRNAGYTLLEVAIAGALMSILTYSLVVASSLGNNSYEAVERATANTREVQEVSESIKQEFKTTNEDNIDIVVLADGNHQVTFQHPLILGGALGWGAYDTSWGPSDDDKNQPGWWIRYTVQTIVNADGDAERCLVREVLDEAFDVQEQDTVATDLRAGNGANPGFQVNQTGDVWAIEMYMEGLLEGSLGAGAMFNVRIRN